MPSALDELNEFNMELLGRNRFCMGKRRGRRYVCHGDANEGAKSKAVSLLIEAVRRMRRWRVWDVWWIEGIMDEWLEKRDRLEVQLRGRYSEEVINDLLGLVDKFINYSERFWNYWQTIGGEAKKLVDDLLSGRAEVIIWEGEKGISVHEEHVTLEAHRASKGSITVQLKLNDLGGVDIEVLNVFRKTMSKREYRRFVKRVLKALRGGFAETDEGKHEGRPVMGTTQIWQVVVWSLLYPGEVHMRINAINVNEGDVTILWHLRSNRHRSLKGKILSNINKLSKEELLAFTFTAVLGDGSADVEKLKINGRAYDKAMIGITMSGGKLKKWEPLFERLKSMGFKSSKPDSSNGNAINVRFYDNNAIDLARAMISILPPILRDTLDALKIDKWERIKRIAKMEMKFRRGEMQINVASYRFSITVQKSEVILVHRAKNNAEVGEVIEALRAVYGDGFYAYVNKSGKYLIVTIPMYVFERYDDIKGQVIEVLRRKLEKTKDEKKKQTIIKHLKRLTTPTKEGSRGGLSWGLL